MSTSSWSSEREVSSRTEERRIEVKGHVDQLQKVLQLLAKDEDLHDDLRMPSVVVAVNHWTGVKRLPPDEAERLSENRRAM